MPINIYLSESLILSETVELDSMVSERLNILVQCSLLRECCSFWIEAPAEAPLGTHIVGTSGFNLPLLLCWTFHVLKTVA